MIRSYRVWSAVMGGWYLLVVASLVAHPPGEAVEVTGGRGAVIIPQHRTFFQNAGGWQFIAAVFAAVAVALIYAACCRWEALARVHLVAMVVCYVFGMGYIATAVALDQAFLAGSFALVVSAGHLIIRKQRYAVMIDDALAERRQ